MYESVKELILDLINAPKGPPAAPTGPHTVQRVFRPAPAYLNYRLFYLAGSMALLGLVFLGLTIALAFQGPLIAVIAMIALSLLWVLIAALGYVLVRLEYDMRYYIITDRSLRIRKGVLSILEQTLTFVNIQNISIEQGPVERLFGLSSLWVETAGGGSSADPQGGMSQNYHQASMNGLNNAEELRDIIRNYLKSLQPDGGLGDSRGRAGRRGGFSSSEVEALREVLAEIKRLRAARGQAPPPAAGPDGA